LLSRLFSSLLSEKTVEWRPSVFPSALDFCQSAVGMFLRSNNRKKDGKDHRYFSIVENHRAGVWSVALSTGSGWQLESWSGGQGPALP